MFFPAYVYVDRICAWCILMLEEGLGSAETGIAGGCELPCVCSELNLGPLHKKQMI